MECSSCISVCYRFEIEICRRLWRGGRRSIFGAGCGFGSHLGINVSAICRNSFRESVSFKFLLIKYCLLEDKNLALSNSGSSSIQLQQNHWNRSILIYKTKKKHSYLQPNKRTFLFFRNRLIKYLSINLPYTQSHTQI